MRSLLLADVSACRKPTHLLTANSRNGHLGCWCQCKATRPELLTGFQVATRFGGEARHYLGDLPMNLFRLALSQRKSICPILGVAMLRVFWALSVAATLSLFSPGLSGQRYQQISVTNGGTIAGTVQWSGPLPRATSLPVNKDSHICDPRGQKTRDLERLVVGAQGGVANTVVFLNSISQGKKMQLPLQRQFLDQKECRYEPHILLVPANAELQMKSSDAVLHTVHMTGVATYNLPFPFPNQTVSRTMPTPGLVSLRCNGGHTWMNAEILVVSHPYYSVTDESGHFELTDVPPGEYELVAWHEGWNVTRHDSSLDVLTERRVERPVFSEPRTWVKKIIVTANATNNVNFEISQK